ncbi:hypothetical protein Tco_0359879 [Tanacetum coccineum]
MDANLVVTESRGIELENSSSENALSKSVNETQMQMQYGKVDMGKALDVGLVVTESSGTESDKQDTSSKSGNDTTHAVDADLRPLNDQERLDEVQGIVLSNACNRSKCHNGDHGSASEEDCDLNKLGRIKDHAVKNLALIAKCTSELYKLQTTTSEPSLNTRTRMVDTIQGVQSATVWVQIVLNSEQSNWLADMDEEIDEQELEAHYSYMAKIQEVPNARLMNIITCAVETDDSNVTPDSPDMCDNDIQDDQNDVECDDERVALANLIANLKLDLDEINRFKKQLKKANATLTQD